MATMKQIREVVNEINQMTGCDEGSDGSVDVHGAIGCGSVVVYDDGLRTLVHTGPKKKDILSGVQRVYNMLALMERVSGKADARQLRESDFWE